MLHLITLYFAVHNENKISVIILHIVKFFSEFVWNFKDTWRAPLALAFYRVCCEKMREAHFFATYSIFIARRSRAVGPLIVVDCARKKDYNEAH
jgi:hypothetical protein